jgi:WD40 repeat protein
VITGKVQDGQTMLPLLNSNISIIGTNKGCATDDNGEFNIEPDTLPVYLIISHVGYETQQIWIEKSSVDVGLNILLQPSVKMLSEIEVTATHEAVTFFKDEEYNVLDYETENTLVYLLVYRFHLARAQLICLSDQGDTISTSGPLPFKPTKLFRDCLGYLHVLTEDSAYQVYLYKDHILFPYHSSIRKFMSTMSGCVASDQEWLFFREESLDHLTVNFFRVNRTTKKRDYLASAADAEKKKILRDNPRDYYYLTMDTLPATSAEIIEYTWVNKILYKANISVMKKIGDTLVVFNTTDGTMSFYNLDGKILFTQKSTLQSSSGEKWTQEILFDEMNHQAYTTSWKNGKLKVFRIDLTSGKLIYQFTTGHIFPEKLRINNNNLFYMYHFPGSGENKQLFRQKL